MEIRLRILRFDPQRDREPAFRDYTVQASPEDRLLDVLLGIKENQDGSLGLRKSCAHGVCGSDAMVINGSERLACKTLVGQVAETEGAVVTVEPLRHLPVQHDLMVDQSRFFEIYRSVRPFQINEEPVPAEPDGTRRERRQSPEERAAFDDATKCILCAACYSACPVLDKNPAFIGPAAIVQAARFAFDNRDRGFEERLDVLDDPNGVWSCENHFKCTLVCPREIKVTKLINMMKRRIKSYREQRGEKPASAP